MLFHRHLGHDMAKLFDLPLGFKFPLAAAPANIPDEQPEQVSENQQAKKP